VVYGGFDGHIEIAFNRQELPLVWATAWGKSTGSCSPVLTPPGSWR
jgi:hypothetical protein